jgi:hypothetical protein
MSSILSPRGQTWVELGGERCWKEPHTKGDIVVAFQWLETGGQVPGACMVLYPVIPKLHGGAYAIPQENAHEYLKANGDPTPAMLTCAFNAAQQMGFFPDESTVFRIVDAIYEGMGDFLRMPSEQPGSFDLKRTVLGIEATAKIGGRVIHQEVV